MIELFRIGHFSIYLFGVTIALGMLAGLIIMLKEAKRKELNLDQMMNLTIYSIIAGMLGARIFYVLVFNLDFYLHDPIKIFALRDGGLSIQGGLIFGILFATFYTRKKNMHFWKAADAFAPGIILGQAIGRIGCDVFGVPFKGNYPWGVLVNGQLLHPTQIYEELLNFALFLYLWKKRGSIKYNGEIFVHYIIGFSIIRAIVEFFRVNPLVFANITVAHVTSLIIIVATLLISRTIKEKNLISVSNVFQETVSIPFVEYLVIFSMAIAGVWFYYFIH